MGVHGAAIIIVYSLRSRRMKIIWAQERRGRALPKRPTKLNFFPLSERAEIIIG